MPALSDTHVNELLGFTGGRLVRGVRSWDRRSRNRTLIRYRLRPEEARMDVLLDGKMLQLNRVRR